MAPDTENILSRWLARSQATPETELVLRCSRPVPDQADACAIRSALARVRDWELVVRLCRWHATTGWVYRRMRAMGTIDESNPAHVALRGHALNITAHAMRHTRELLRIVRTLGEAGITVLPFKGPVLAAQAYGDPGVRQFVDLDLLVRAEDMPRTRDILMREGYAHSLQLSEHEETALARAGWEYCMINAERGCQIDLETTVAPVYFAFDLDMHRLWRDAVTIDLDGTPVRTLSPESALVLLCVHGTKHNWIQHVWIADIAGLLSRVRLNWNHVLDIARAGKAERMLFVGLRLAQVMMAAPIPPESQRGVSGSRQVDRLAFQAAGHTLRTPIGAMGPFEECVFHMRCRERPADRIRYAARLAASPSYSDWRTLPLPRPLRPLYYLTRPFRLAAKGLRTLLRRGRQ